MNVSKHDATAFRITRIEAKTFAPDDKSPLVQRWVNTLHHWVRVDCGAGGHCAYYCVAKLLKSDYSKAFSIYTMEELMKVLRGWTADQLQQDIAQGLVDLELLRHVHAFDIRGKKSVRTSDIVDGVRTHFWANNLTLGCLQSALISHGFLLYLMLFDMRSRDAQPIGFVSLAFKPTRGDLGDRLGVLLYDTNDRGGHFTLMGHIHKTPGVPAQVRYGMTLPQLRQAVGNLVHPRMWPNL